MVSLVKSLDERWGKLPSFSHCEEGTRNLHIPVSATVAAGIGQVICQIFDVIFVLFKCFWSRFGALLVYYSYCLFCLMQFFWFWDNPGAGVGVCIQRLDSFGRLYGCLCCW